MTARIEITADSITVALQQAGNPMLREAATRVMLLDIGEYLLGSTRERAARQVSPSGETWRKLSPAYKRFKDKKRPGLPILKFDNHMLGDQLAYQVEGSTLLLGTNAKYGAAHQFGSSIEIAPRSQQVYFRRNKRGEVGKLFVKKKQSNFAQRVTLPRYMITIPARPWLGISAADSTEISAIVADYVPSLFGQPNS